MIDENLVALLRCPLTAQRLGIAKKTLVSQLNTAIESGRLRDRTEGLVEVPIEGGLITEDGQMLYAIRDQIPNLVADEAIPLGQSGLEPSRSAT